MDTAQVSPDTVKSRHWGRECWGLVALLVLAWALRLPPMLDNRFHADEALYGYWGLLIGQGRDPWLATVPVYKPPVLPYLVAGAQALFGNSEFAVRLPGLTAGLLTIPLAAMLSRALYGERWAAIGAATGLALSPFAILFSATAFADLPMVALGLGGCVAAARGRPGWAGVLAGLACATKQSGVVWLLLVALVQIANCRSQIADRRLQIASPQIRKSANHHSPFAIRHSPFVHSSIRRFVYSQIRHSPFAVRFVVGFLLVAGLVFAWDAVRVAQGAESFWRMGVTGYGGLRLIWPQELWTRLRGWIGLARYFFVSPVVNGALPVGLSLLVWNATSRHRHTRVAFVDLSLISFSLIYFLLHWLWAFPVWDRYLLPLVPVLAILLGRILSLLASHLANRQIGKSANRQTAHSSIRRFVNSQIRHSPFVIVHCSLFILLLLPAWNAVHSRYPVGGDHGAYDGIDGVVAFLRTLPEGTVVYQHWLGWHYNDYLFDAPVYLAYWPTPAWLAQDVRAFGTRESRYIVFPSWESSARVGQALAGVGYELASVLTTTRRDGTRSFTVYHIQPFSDP